MLRRVEAGREASTSGAVFGGVSGDVAGLSAVLVVGMAACGSGDTPPPERVSHRSRRHTPKGTCRSPSSFQQPRWRLASDPAETTTVGPDPEPASVLLVEPARLEAAPEAWGGYDRERFPHWSEPPRVCRRAFYLTPASGAGVCSRW